MPAADGVRDMMRIAIAQPTQRIERFRIVCRGGKKQLLLSRLGGSCLLEQAGVVLLNAVELGEKSLGKRIPIGKAESRQPSAFRLADLPRRRRFLAVP